MKSTGVVRKIDDLGRLVIPKELRKTLKVNEGDSLEIFVDDSSIILKKYSVFDDSISISKKLVDSFYKVFKSSVLITDKYKVIASSSNIDGKYYNCELTSSIKNYINDRIEVCIDHINITTTNSKEDKVFVYPIINNSDIIGSIILINVEISDNIRNIVHLLGDFLIKNIEE